MTGRCDLHYSKESAKNKKESKKGRDMKVVVSYDEIAAYIEEKYGARIALSNVDETTVKVDYKVNKLLPAVSLDVQFLWVSNDRVLMVYDASVALKKIIEGLLFMIRDKMPSDFVQIDTEKCHVALYPMKNQKCRDLLKGVKLRELRCTESDAELDVKI